MCTKVAVELLCGVLERGLAGLPARTLVDEHGSDLIKTRTRATLAMSAASSNCTECSPIDLWRRGGASATQN
jgi:hypothetical protein